MPNWETGGKRLFCEPSGSLPMMRRNITAPIRGIPLSYCTAMNIAAGTRPLGNNGPDVLRLIRSCFQRIFAQTSKIGTDHRQRCQKSHSLRSNVIAKNYRQNVNFALFPGLERVLKYFCSAAND